MHSTLVLFSLCALQADVGNKYLFFWFGSILTWLSLCYDSSLDILLDWCGSQICRIHSSFPMIWKLIFVSRCCKLSKYWRREKKLLEVSSGRGCTDVSFPDSFTVLAVSTSLWPWPEYDIIFKTWANAAVRFCLYCKWNGLWGTLPYVWGTERKAKRVTGGFFLLTQKRLRK